jgi:hypothetical protein
VTSSFSVVLLLGMEAMPCSRCSRLLSDDYFVLLLLLTTTTTTMMIMMMISMSTMTA